MQSNYKPIGDYIRLIDNRNSDLAVSELLGVSINKTFIPSVANVIGSDMANYKIIRKNQFACSLMQVRRDKKIPVALYSSEQPAIISQAYPVFEIIDSNTLLPEYLMMWFSRSEFDREACFYAVGGVRGSLEWDDFCKMQLPIPSLTKQQEAVDEYNIIQRRIDLNKQFCEKLEETAQTLYRKYFVDDIDEENLPEGWRWGKLGELIDIKYGKSYFHLKEGEIPLYGSGGLMGKVDKAIYNKPSVLIPRKGTLSNIMFVNIPFWCVDTMFYSIFKNDLNGYYSYYILKQLDFDALNQGSAVPSMTTVFLNDIKVLLPEIEILRRFNSSIHKIISQKEILEQHNLKLNEFQSLLLTKMGRKEN